MLTPKPKPKVEIVIDSSLCSSPDGGGFALDILGMEGQSCESVAEDFREFGTVVSSRKKPEYEREETRTKAQNRVKA